MIELIKNCTGCQEAYDVYDSDKQIGYIRFRFGQLEVHPMKDSDVDWRTTVLSKSINDDYLVTIPDNLREGWINEAIQKLTEYYK